MSRWQYLALSPNDQQNLIVKAKSLASFLTQDAFEHANAYVELLTEQGVLAPHQFQNAVGSIYLDCVWFGMHYVDRYAYSHLDEQSRNIFYDVLEIEIFEYLLKRQEQAGAPDLDTFSKGFRKGLNDLQLEYSKYGFAEDDLDHHLLYQFGIRLGKLLGLGKDKRCGVAMILTSMVFFELLDLESLLNISKTCVNCKKESPRSAKFCNACGESLQQ